ncbi:tail fiber assembly protein [Thiomicrorhabdus sp. Kp2]|uniref:tail fiber assembly protein n=1 Tax=Thiomicrorhabdus sp. Kp2 TaxID=1123518 RepID=UPI000421C2FB|nr:tail fiber assembly protein [Thiomicrorhabdus sp. Kp2]
MKIFFSATTGGFYPSTMQADYKAVGTWPADAIELTELEKATYWRKQPPEGKKLGADVDGRPLWVDLPPLSAEEQAILDNRLAKQTGELYADTGITVPFTNEVANGLMQIKNGFDAAKDLVATGAMTQADYDALSANLEISPTVKLPLTPATILPFSAWFWTKRSAFF